MEQRESQVLRLHPQPLQSLLIPLQIQKMEADCWNLGEHLSGEQIGDQEVAGGAESTKQVQNNQPITVADTLKTWNMSTMS